MRYLVLQLQPGQNFSFFLLCSFLAPRIATMMKLTIVAALVGSAAAFAPTQVTQTSMSALNADLSKELGAQAPVSTPMRTP